MDLVIRNAVIVDGSGAPGRLGDVGLKNGRIAAVGTVPEKGQKEIDAGGAVLSPGFIDCHTHYDAQVFWDPALTPSVNHGVTTALAGNCGFTLAPLSGRPEDTDYLMRMLSRVEGMPLETLRQALNPTWTRFGEYLDALEGTPSINIGFLVGHSALRRAVMGDRAIGQAATASDVSAMAELLDQSLADGGLGFSSTLSVTHSDMEGQPVPSRASNKDELMALAQVAGRHPGTWLEMIPSVGMFDEQVYDLMADLSVTAQRPINWNMLSPVAFNRPLMENQLGASDHARKKGGMVLALVSAVPPKTRLNFISGFVLDVLPGWSPVLMLPQAEKVAALRDPATRARLIAAFDQMGSHPMGMMFQSLDQWLLDETFLPHNKVWQGKLLGEYAASVGKPPIEALFDLALEEDLRTSFSPPVYGSDDESWRLRAQAWQDPRCVVGASDAGAHLDMIDTFAFSTQLLGNGVRGRGLLPLETAVKLITSVPAQRFGLTGRGTIEVGAHADLVVFDPATVGCGPVVTRDDLPGGQSRLYAEAQGIHHVIVNGQVVLAEGQLTGERAGTVLRSGRDTATVSMV